jgi:hypothetical protein
MVAKHKIIILCSVGQDGNSASESNVLDFSLHCTALLFYYITTQIHYFTSSSQWAVTGQPSIPLHQTTYICFKQQSSYFGSNHFKGVLTWKWQYKTAWNRQFYILLNWHLKTCQSVCKLFKSLWRLCEKVVISCLNIFITVCLEIKSTWRPSNYYG